MPEDKTEEKVEEVKKAAKIPEINFNRVITKRDGEPIRYRPEFVENHEFCEECAKKVNAALGNKMTVGSVCIDILDSMPQDTGEGKKKVDPKEKYRRGKLAEKIYDTVGPMDLDVEDRALLKKLVGEVQTPLVISQVFPELDSKLKEE